MDTITTVTEADTKNPGNLSGPPTRTAASFLACCLLLAAGVVFAADTLPGDGVDADEELVGSAPAVPAAADAAPSETLAPVAADAAPEADAVEPANAPADQPTEDADVEAAVAGLVNIDKDVTGPAETIGPPAPDPDEPAAGEETKRPQVAENIDLSEPIEPDAVDEIVEEIDVGTIEPPEQPDLSDDEQKSLLLLGAEVPAGTSTRLAWRPDQNFEGIAVPTPVLVVNGSRRGPTLCLTAAVHGDELNGIETVRRVLYNLEPERLSGAVVGVPIVNLQGFRRSSRYLPDRRDLNRYFPGNPRGSAAARLAHSFFTEVIAHCDALVDLHTGSFKRTNLPQLRANLKIPEVVELTQGFGSTVVLHGVGAEGTLRRAAADAGIPAVTVEAGEPTRIQDKEVAHTTKGIMTLLNELDMYHRTTNWGNKEPVYYRSTWVRADSGGVLFGKVDLGDRVREDELLGTITDPITNVKTELRAPVKGRILGKALDQFVMPGFAAFRIGIEREDSEIAPPSDITVTSVSDDAEQSRPTETPVLVDVQEEDYDDHDEESVLVDDHRDGLEDSE
jgi:predicted deacylase